MSEYDAEHIINALKQHYYTIMVDKEATKYFGLTIKLD